MVCETRHFWKRTCLPCLERKDKLISTKEAQDLVLGRTAISNTESLSLEDSIGRILRQEVVADRNQPPFNRVAMDGIAINLDAYQTGKRSFKIEDIQPAGSPIKTLKNLDNCLEAMTGAVLPNNCNAVIRYEDLSINDGIATINEELTLKHMHNVHQEGVDHKKGDLLIKPNVKIKSSHIAVLASCGITDVVVSKIPKIAIISTGSELVEINEKPLDHQIRKSNSHSLKSELLSHGFKDVSLFHFSDNEKETFEGLKNVLIEFPVVILSGGVSMGKFDFVPKALTDLKVEKVFHKIKQKPGKPFWFGQGADKQNVFALPGNPVSCLVCLRRYVIPSLLKNSGLEYSETLTVRLDSSFFKKKPMAFFLPVKVENKEGENFAEVIKTNGSGDYYSLVHSDGIIELEESQSDFSKGDIVTYYGWGN